MREVQDNNDTLLQSLENDKNARKESCYDESITKEDQVAAQRELKAANREINETYNNEARHTLADTPVLRDALNDSIKRNDIVKILDTVEEKTEQIDRDERDYREDEESDTDDEEVFSDMGDSDDSDGPSGPGDNSGGNTGGGTGTYTGPGGAQNPNSNASTRIDDTDYIQDTPDSFFGLADLHILGLIDIPYITHFVYLVCVLLRIALLIPHIVTIYYHIKTVLLD